MTTDLTAEHLHLVGNDVVMYLDEFVTADPGTSFEAAPKHPQETKGA